MYATDTSHLELKGSLIHCLPRKIVQQFEIKPIRNGLSRFSLIISGGLAKENHATFENLDFTSLGPDKLQLETATAVEHPLGYEKPVLFKIIQPYSAIILVPKDVEDKAKTILLKSGFILSQ
ncbi:MAG: hypothetical protein DWQ02_06690 [Bacteroidetes bacterium]|nr:MAG: hypothetical protein DWQ02_06690 [Bacteroidota bacterium]